MGSDAAAAPELRKPWVNILFQGLPEMGRNLQLLIAAPPAAGIPNRLDQRFFPIMMFALPAATPGHEPEGIAEETRRPVTKE